MKEPEPAITTTAASARMESLASLRSGLVSRYLHPVPCLRTLQQWFSRAKLRSIKANPRAKRGGGVVYFNRAAVERYLRDRTGRTE